MRSEQLSSPNDRDITVNVAEAGIVSGADGVTFSVIQHNVPKEKTKLTIQRHQRRVQYFTEDLGNGIGIDLILVTGGSFLRGSPEDEPERLDTEGPQYQVTVPPFFMGRYPVTQAQWSSIATLPKINQKLKRNPSYFKGKNLPVEQVSWWEAVEFCDRLSRRTDKTYRLPTEAEWEYSCRAGTTTPFHTGETITTDLANYRGEHIYRRGVKGVYRAGTSEVGSFPANAFGLCDMHGNVWEWCLDHWHKNYEGAPTDGSAWLTDDNKAGRVIRGGSLFNPPSDCRSAFRLSNNPIFRNYDFGFRVVCVLPRTQ